MESTQPPGKRSSLAAVWRVISYFVLHFGVQLGVAVLSGMIWGMAGGEGSNSTIDSLNLLIPAVIVLAIMRRRLGAEWELEGFWRIGRLPFATIALCAGVGFAMNIAINGLFASLLSVAADGETERTLMTSMLDGSLLGFIAVNLAIPVIEETVFRGIMLKRMRETKLKLPAALIIQAVLFAALHTGGVQITYSFIMGIIYGLIYIRAGSVLPAIAAHITFNALSAASCNS